MKNEVKAVILNPESAQKRIRDYVFKKNSCTVCALAAVADIPFSEAEKYARECGWKEGSKLSSRELLQYAAAQGVLSYQEVPLPTKKLNPYRVRKHRGKTHWHKVSLDRFVQAYPQGCFYVRQNGHALAVIDGVVINPFHQSLSGRSLLKNAWKIEKKESSPTSPSLEPVEKKEE